ncbi:phosphoglycerate dehydrogenase [Blautia marasmi]|uniref:phosphoglycerate dehydrogenase n=1 Tax=Blautia marasmi TaxID=1917868 RepID=UPI001D08A7BF|nr:phosphoglycerate dehydrogenase [Blautia marasmi]MCB6195548.1 phosphoglycerate dehydrogenase [Blautia marasmi]
MKNNVLILADAKREYFREAERLLKAQGILYRFGDPLKVKEKELADQAKEAQAVIAGSERWTRKVMEKCPELKVIVRCGTGYDGIDMAAASDLGIQVANTPGLNTYAVAEMALSMILTLKRRLLDYDRMVRNGEWEPVPASELRGKTIGLVGFGGVARQLARLLQPFQCRILAYDVYQDKEAAKKLNTAYTNLERVFRDSDVISLHLPLLDETKHLIDKKAFELMKPECIMVNTSRGGIVCTEDLINALDEGRIAGAALDVFEEEPLSDDSELCKSDRIILSPHVASATKETTEQMILVSVKEIIRYYTEGKPENLLNPQAIFQKRGNV